MNDRHATKKAKGYKMSGGLKSSKGPKYSGAMKTGGKRSGKKGY